MATSVVNPRAQFFANNGRPLIGGRIHTYVAGSSTRARTYKDAAKAQPNTNPIILDGRGEAQIYLAEGVEYKFVVEDSKGALIYTQEPVYGAVWPNTEQWPSDATLSYQYMSEAKAAAGAIGPIKFYDTLAQAQGDLANLTEGDLVEIAQDEGADGARTRRRFLGGALAFVVNLDQIRVDLAAAGETKGASLVRYGSRTVAKKLGDTISFHDFAHLVTDKPNPNDYTTWDWHPAVQDMFNYSSERKIPIQGIGGRFRVGSPVTYGSNTVYHGNGAVLVKAFTSSGYSDALLVNEAVFSLQKTTDVDFTGLRLTDGPESTYGSLLVCSYLESANIQGLRINKKSGSWAIPMAGENIQISNAIVQNNTSGLYGDCLHITQGNLIQVSDSILISTSDDALAVHPQEASWVVNGVYNGVGVVTVSNSYLKSPTNAFKTGAEAEDGGFGGVNWSIDRVVLENCSLIGGAQLRDERNSTAPVNGEVILRSCNLTDDITIAAPNSGGSPRWKYLEIDDCRLTNAGGGASFISTPSEKAIQRVVIKGRTRSDRHMLVTASEKIEAPDLQVKTSTTTNSVEFNSRIIVAPNIDVQGAATEFRGVYLANSGGTVAYADLQNSRVTDVARGISSSENVGLLDVRGVTFSNCTVGDVTATAAKVLRSIAVEASYSVGSIPANGSVDFTATAQGASPGDVVSIAYTPNNANVRAEAWVNAANLVLVKFRNFSSSAITLGAVSVKVKVDKV